MVPHRGGEKIPKPKTSGTDGAKDASSWAKGKRPNVGESGKDSAERLLNDKYGPGNWKKKGPKTEFNKIKKWGDRSFIDPWGRERVKSVFVVEHSYDVPEAGGEEAKLIGICSTREEGEAAVRRLARCAAP